MITRHIKTSIFLDGVSHGLAIGSLKERSAIILINKITASLHSSSLRISEYISLSEWRILGKLRFEPP